MMLGIQEVASLGGGGGGGGGNDEIISPHKYPKNCSDGGVLQHQVLMVHHTSPKFSHSGDQIKYVNSQSSDLS
jgi:hypothetical protein